MAQSKNLKQFCVIDHCPFYTGVVFALSFIFTPVFLLSSLPLLVYMLFCGRSWRKPAKLPPILWVALAIALLHILGLIIGETAYWVSKLRDISVVVIIAILYVLGRESTLADSKARFRGFFIMLIAGALIVSILGLIKAVLLGQGIIFAFLIDPLRNDLTIGTSLRQDYNIFSLFLLAASIGLILLSFEKRCFWRTVFQTWLPVVLVVSAALLSGSKRALFLIPLLPVYWFVIGLKIVPKQSIAKQVVLPITLVAISVAMVCWGVISSYDAGKNRSIIYTHKREAQDRDASNASEKDRFFLLLPFQLEIKPGSQAQDVYNKRIPANMLSEKSAVIKKAELTAPRLDRWEFGWSLLRETGWLGGGGFSYHEAFSCKYWQCAYLDYPHFVFLSEWLIGGLPGLLLTVLFYFLLLRTLVRNGWSGLLNGSSALLLLVLPFSMISGDTILSLPQLFVSGLMVHDGVKNLSENPALG